MPRLSAANLTPARNRVLDAASVLFAQFGYRGVTTRDIALKAGVNEVTIFRLYRRKHELYFAALETELQAIHLRGDLLSSIADAPTGRIALDRTFHLISSIIDARPNLIRLLHFSILEMADEAAPVLRKHLGQLIQVLARYLSAWISSGELPAVPPANLVLLMMALASSDRTFSRIFAPGEMHHQKEFLDFFWQIGAKSPDETNRIG